MRLFRFTKGTYSYLQFALPKESAEKLWKLFVSAQKIDSGDGGPKYTVWLYEGTEEEIFEMSLKNDRDKGKWLRLDAELVEMIITPIMKDIKHKALTTEQTADKARDEIESWGTHFELLPSDIASNNKRAESWRSGNKKRKEAENEN